MYLSEQDDWIECEVTNLENLSNSRTIYIKCKYQGEGQQLILQVPPSVNEILNRLEDKVKDKSLYWIRIKKAREYSVELI